ncbi:hypothetical protein MA16_Dca022884 [Dendrobium catenatum]|uniref:Uncharacterized protein n=1 Tax=Dendrobium catenatum TaxID=906689 RepID=A0A2I0VVT8_9ASPA|nr:hypothetical protein MA16_Dca022884 [Dendrobium catenatum]
MAWTIYIGQLKNRAMIRTIEIGFKLIGQDDRKIGQDDVTNFLLIVPYRPGLMSLICTDRPGRYTYRPGR